MHACKLASAAPAGVAASTIVATVRYSVVQLSICICNTPLKLRIIDGSYRYRTHVDTDASRFAFSAVLSSHK